MSDYRAYLRNEKNNQSNRQKRCRRRILVGILALALVTYIGISTEDGSKKISKLFPDSSLDVQAEADTVETVSDKTGIVSRLAPEPGSVSEFLNQKLRQLADILYSSTVGDRELPIYCVDTQEKKIAISFDAAWGAEDFEKIMKILDKHDIKVTFFMTGGWVEDNPDCVKELIKKGHDLGNHSEHHYDMTTISNEEMKQELMTIHDKVKELTDYDMFLFRPPYGAYNNAVIRMAYDNGYFPIQWSVDSLDWKDYGVDSIIKTVCNHEALGPGAIILCHNGAKYTAEALDTMITNLKEQGYEFVPISELIMRENYHMDVTGKQVAD